MSLSRLEDLHDREVDDQARARMYAFAMVAIVLLVVFAVVIATWFVGQMQ